MQKIVALLLIALGSGLKGAGAITVMPTMMGLRGPRGAMTIWSLAMGLLVGSAGVALAVIGKRSLGNGRGSAGELGAGGSYLPDVTETRLLGEREYEVHYQTPIRGKRGRPSKLTVRVP